MSPIIELQRRMVEAGRIRAGEKGDKGEPRKLDKWRLTSKDRQRLSEAADLWGGDVVPWREEYELHTATAELPIMLLPGHLPTTWYELWSKGGCQRRCDGVHEMISDGGCLCDPDERECKPYTRLSVLLPDLPGIGSWLLSSTGWNAAAELAGSADLLQRASAQGVLLPARLRLEQRTSIKQGLTRKFAVPVIDIDTTFRALLGGQPSSELPPRPELPSGFKPIAPVVGNGGISLADGLADAERETVRQGRSAPLPAADVDLAPSPIEVDDAGAPTPLGSPTPTGAPATSRDMNPTKKQVQTLNSLVGQLRDGGHITTEHLWSALANARSVDVDTMIELLHGRDDEGVLHWSPLREDMRRGEASDLIDRLTRLESNVA